MESIVKIQDNSFQGGPMLFVSEYKIAPENRDVAQERFKKTGGAPPQGVKVIGRFAFIGAHSGTPQVSPDGRTLLLVAVDAQGMKHAVVTPVGFSLCATSSRNRRRGLTVLVCRWTFHWVLRKWQVERSAAFAGWPESGLFERCAQQRYLDSRTQTRRAYASDVRSFGG